MLWYYIKQHLVSKSNNAIYLPTIVPGLFKTQYRFTSFKTKVTAKGGKSHDSVKVSEDLKVAHTNLLVLKWVKRQTRKLDQ